MDVLTTITAALDGRPVRGVVCPEAGAGAGSVTAGLLDAGAKQVYAVTSDPEHATIVCDRVAPSPTDRARTVMLEANAQSLPLVDDLIGVTTVHGLFNLVDPASVTAVARELTRAVTLGCRLVVDGYESLPDDAVIWGLFTPESATSQLVRGRPALTFYPADTLGALFSRYGWRLDHELTLLDPVPRFASRVEVYVPVVTSLAADVPDPIGGWLADEAERVVGTVESESVGEMYSVTMRLSDSVTAGASEQTAATPRGRTSRRRTSR